MMTSKILKSASFKKTKKKKQKHELHIKRYFMTKDSFVVEVTFNTFSDFYILPIFEKICQYIYTYGIYIELRFFDFV